MQPFTWGSEPHLSRMCLIRVDAVLSDACLLFYANSLVGKGYRVQGLFTGLSVSTGRS